MSQAAAAGKEAMNHRYGDYQRDNPFRAPDWRWQRARSLIGAGRNFSRRRDDESTGRAVHYLRTVNRGRRSPGRLCDFADVHAARQLHESGGALRLLVEARVLARQAPALIALLAGVPAHVVETYEDLFFSCRDRLDARDWILAHAIGRGGCPLAPEPDPGAVLKAFAYFGGPAVLEAVLRSGAGAWCGVPPGPTAAENSLGQSARLAFLAHLLPRDAATDRKLLRIASILREPVRGPRVPAAPPALLGARADAALRGLPAAAWTPEGPVQNPTPESGLGTAGGLVG
jgi:hypothetical protein